MSRVAKSPINIPTNVKVILNSNLIEIEGNKGKLRYTIHSAVKVDYINNQLIFTPRAEFSDADAWTQAGTTRAIVNTMVIGVSKGFSKKLQLMGVGFRASIKNNNILLSLGFSHLIEYKLPIDIIAKCPSPTEIILEGINKQVIGQVAAELRTYRRIKPYKARGIYYEDEIVRTKETKKKK